MERKDIKTALMHCAIKMCEGCPHEKESDCCQMLLAKDALNLVKYLESDVKYYTALTEIQLKTIEAMEDIVKMWEERLKKKGGNEDDQVNE